MKFIIALIATFSLSSFADHHEEKFAEMKAKGLANIDKRISSLQQLKSCLSSASEKEAARKCRKENRARMENLRQDFRAGKKRWRKNKQK